MRPERVQRILGHPLDYLHPQRLCVPPLLDTPQARHVLEDIILHGLGATACEAELEASPATDLWLRSWLLLPRVARLMGAQAAWPHLARGAAFRSLSAAVREFAPCSVAPRLQDFDAQTDSERLGEQLDAIGLNALLAWRGHVAPVLIERLPLQFPAPVIELQRVLVPATPDAVLLTLAIQHARIHSHSD
jgi:type III secretion system OrgA/MxiK family protein